MGIVNSIKTFILAPVDRYYIYKRIVQGELGLKGRNILAGGDAKGKNLIFKAIKNIKKSEIRRASDYYSIDNTDQLNDKIYRKEQQLVRGIIDTLRNEFTKYPENRERERALDTMDLELNEYVELMNKARRNVKDDRARREEVWDIPEKIPEQNFSQNEWERLKEIHNKYFDKNDKGLKKMEEAVLWKSDKIDYMVEDFVKYVHLHLIKREVDPYDPQDNYLYSDPTDVVLIKRLEDLDKYFNNTLNCMLQDFYHEPLRPETKAQLLKQIEMVKKIRKDFRRMSREWEELREFSIESGASRTEEERAWLENVYDSLYQLEKRYEEYNNGLGLKELERVREKLGINKPNERNLQDMINEAKGEKCKEVVKENGERKGVHTTAQLVDNKSR